MAPVGPVIAPAPAAEAVTSIPPQVSLSDSVPGVKEKVKGKFAKVCDGLDYERCLEPAPAKIPISHLLWDRDAKFGQTRVYDMPTVEERLGNLKACPPLEPLRCIVWRDEGIHFFCFSFRHHFLSIVLPHFLLPFAHCFGVCYSWTTLRAGSAAYYDGDEVLVRGSFEFG